jgi:1-aminocyclopropane-1-carboxylate deaminase/D-cysteine desulfhydrase-like pyridoxal-dependent ACC family enzyme
LATPHLPPTKTPDAAADQAAGGGVPAAAGYPLLERFPGLSALPRAVLTTLPSPVEDASHVMPGLWLKRDDLNSPVLGGNKVRALEFLLGDVRAGQTVVTVGGTGSSHALATVMHARRLGARTQVGLWRQEQNPSARRVHAALLALADDHREFRTVPGALAYQLWHRWRGARSIPAGGTVPLGILGHVNAALELAAQVHAGRLPPPARVVVPLGTGGTAAGLALGFRIAGLACPVIGARVVPRIVARRGRVLALAHATRRLIMHHGGTHVPRVTADDIHVVHEVYGGAYGRELPSAGPAAMRLAPLRLDATYSAKACAAALSRCDGAPLLFWVTFDPRALDDLPMTPPRP